MPSSVQGAQVVSRVAAVLRIVSEGAASGVTTAGVAAAAVLTRPTAHRLLSSLAAEGFVDRDDELGRWVLGPELYLLGSVAAARYDVAELALPSVRALARETGESAFLSARRGDETVCLLREEGSFPLRSFVLAEGVRFPLGVASAGMAIIAYLPDAERAAFLDRHELTESHGPQHARAQLERRAAETRLAGFATNPGLVLEGSFGMAAAVFDQAGRPAWALSITGVEQRFPPRRRPELGRLLLEHAHALTQRLRRAGR